MPDQVISHSLQQQHQQQPDLIMDCKQKEARSGVYVMVVDTATSD